MASAGRLLLRRHVGVCKHHHLLAACFAWMSSQISTRILIGCFYSLCAAFHRRLQLRRSARDRDLLAAGGANTQVQNPSGCSHTVWRLWESGRRFDICVVDCRASGNCLYLSDRQDWFVPSPALKIPAEGLALNKEQIRETLNYFREYKYWIIT